MCTSRNRSISFFFRPMTARSKSAWSFIPKSMLSKLILVLLTVLLTKRGRLALSRHALLFHGLEDVRYGVVSVRELVSASRALVITRFPRAPTVLPVVRGAVAFAVNVAHRSA